MNQEITTASVRRWLAIYAARIFAEEAQLAELDAAIGDGDHGANMVRGWRKVQSWLDTPSQEDADIGTVLRSVAMLLISNIGGAAGPLYGAFFLRAAKDGSGKHSVTLMEWTQMFRSGLDGVQQRGKAVVGEKTMVDAFAPAVSALAEAVANNQSLSTAFAAAAVAAEQGLHATIDLEATKGRASYLGPRSIGHQDPGATSTYFLFVSALEALESVGAAPT